MKARAMIALCCVSIAVLGMSCGDDESEAEDVGIAGNCAQTTDCPKIGDIQLACLTVFKGGYCGTSGCTADTECPSGSACVTVNSVNYCFLVCTEKTDCNSNRTLENEANCVGNATHVGTSTAKVCVPPSGT